VVAVKNTKTAAGASMKARKVPGFENEYVITRNARVFRRLSDGFKEISQATQKKSGYKTVVLYKDGKPHFKYVHQLVGDAFLKNPDNKEIVNHKDGDKSNCSVGNLIWADGSENTAHAYDTGLAHGARGEANGQTDLSDADASKIRKSDASGESLAKKYGITPAAVSMIKAGKRRAESTKEWISPADVAGFID